jgi:hypothetical protein
MWLHHMNEFGFAKAYYRNHADSTLESHHAANSWQLRPDKEAQFRSDVKYPS